MSEATPVTLIRVPALGDFPNNERCPAIVYRSAFSGASASQIEERFAANGWEPAWRAGVYTMHHYHSTAHEALGCFAGNARLQLGGPAGPELQVSAGDVLVIPAGVAHKALESAGGFRVVGAYAAGRPYDMNYGESSERARAEQNLDAVPLPDSDPVLGSKGPLRSHWSV